jgi:hypothetical protein
MVLKSLKALGIEASLSKYLIEGLPSPTIIWLGIHVDFDKNEKSIDPTRRNNIRTMLKEQWVGRKKANYQQLASLHGVLMFLVSIITSTAPFLTAIRIVMALAERKHYSITLGSGFHYEIKFWIRVLEANPNMPLVRSILLQYPHIITTDAAMLLGTGFGAFIIIDKKVYYFGGIWSSKERKEISTKRGDKRKLSINTLELYTIYLAYVIFSRYLPPNSKVGFLVRCDNSASVYAINKMRSLTQPIMNNILREVIHVATESTGDLHTPIVSNHIKGVINKASDALSRDRIPEGLEFLKSEVVPAWVKEHKLPTNSVFEYINLSQTTQLIERKLVTEFIKGE